METEQGAPELSAILRSCRHRAISRRRKVAKRTGRDKLRSLSALPDFRAARRPIIERGGWDVRWREGSGRKEPSQCDASSCVFSCT